MKNKRLWIAFVGLALFILLIALAIVMQSAYLLYAASLLPVFIVPFLPDIRSRQRLKAGGRTGIDLYLLKPLGAPRAEFLVVEFAPGSLNWAKPDVYFPLTEDKYPVFTEPKASQSASLSVLPYDLSVHGRKAGWYRLNLRQLRERTESFSFTYREIGRFMIRLDDVRALSMGSTISTPAASNKGLQA